MEFLLSDNLDSTNYKNFVDLESFADHWIIQELTQNIEPKYPYSVYAWKNSDTKLHAGPIWDFDWQTFSPYVKGLLTKNALWNKALLKHKEYRALVKEKWFLYKPNFEKIPTTIDSLASYIQFSNELSHQRWPMQIKMLDVN